MANGLNNQFAICYALFAKLDDEAVFGMWLVAYGKWFDYLPYHRQTVFWHEMKVISRGDINLC
jgi:hypothetical protein